MNRFFIWIVLTFPALLWLVPLFFLEAEDLGYAHTSYALFYCLISRLWAARLVLMSTLIKHVRLKNWCSEMVALLLSVSQLLDGQAGEPKTVSCLGMWLTGGA